MTTKVRKARAKRAVERAIRKIDPEDAASILEAADINVEEKVEKSKQTIPGQTRETGKSPWTWDYLSKNFPIKELHPEETELCTWNGISFQLIVGAIHYVPEPFYAWYQQHRANIRRKPTDFGKNWGFDTTIALGAGPLPPE